ncbi:MAG TPA: serine/threonine-protein kinase [Kofleriaceae bacterium]|nr:serine/threonine-protein kinase [Kofleriaceae bacterium]
MVDSPLAHGPTLLASDPRRDQLEPGHTAGEYVVDRFLGAGAMGEVYAGHHPVIGKKVAIKVLRRDAGSASDSAERFVREARAASQIDHPNVIDVFAFGKTDDGRLYLAMELIEGRTLREVVGEGPLAADRALAILEPIADALDAAHARGVIHRDLKPENIMLAGEHPRVLVLDFGLAKLVAAAGEGQVLPKTLTGQGTWLGTPGYMAPEQWSVDGACAASDRYALGVIAFELLAGAPPFQAASVPAMMEQHFRAPVPALSARGRALPASVDDVLNRALAKDPAARFATARELVAALREALAERRTVAVKRPWLPAAAGAGVLAVGVVTVLAIRRGDDAPRAPEVGVGTLSIAISTLPDGADLTIDGKPAGQAPATINPHRGDTIELVARKPGYLAARRTFIAGDDAIAVGLRLETVSRFEGVWRLPDGQLRAFERGDDHVDVFKLDAVAGPRAFYRHYRFAPVETGVAFATDDEVVDPRAPDEPSCHVPVHVEYRYDPAKDALVLRREVVELDLADGHCVVHARRVDEAPVARADAPTDTVVLPSPAGSPPKAQKHPKMIKTSNPTPSDKELHLQEKDAKSNSSNAPPQAMPQQQAF